MRFMALAVLTLGTCAAACARPVAREGKLRVARDLTLHYRIIGNGSDTVIVLHGGPGLHSSYLTTALDPLAAGRALIYYDQRGRGRSDGVADSAAISAAQDVEDLDAVRKAFGLSRISLIGHHWGAVLAALYAKRYPDHVKRLLLVSPSFPHASYLFWAATLLKADSVTTRYLAALSAGADTTDPRGFCAKYWGFLFSPTPVVVPKLVRDLSVEMCDAPPAALRESWRVNRLVPTSLHGLNLRDTLDAVHAPVLVIEGDADTASAAAAHAWAAWAPDAREITVPGPALFPWLGPAMRFREAADEFLAGRWPPGSAK